MNDLNEIYYSKDDFEKIIHVFTKNQIKLEFEDPLLLLNAIQSISRYCTQKELSIAFDESKFVTLLEFDIKNKKIISTGSGYPYSNIGITQDPNINTHLKTIKEIFSFHPRSIIDIFGSYMIMKSFDESNIEDYYYWIEPQLLTDIEKDSWAIILEQFNMSEKTIAFLNKHDYVCLDYIGFDFNNVINKIGFSTKLESFLNNAPENEYKNYKNINNVLTVVENFFDLKTTFLALQYSYQQKDYFSIEIFLPIDKSLEFFTRIYKLDIIDQQEFENFKQMTIPDEYVNCILKFRWEDESKFGIKFCIEKYENNDQLAN